MRKLILIAAIATMSSSACHANLSLASNEPLPETIAKPSAQALEARGEAFATTVKPADVAKPKPRARSRGDAVAPAISSHALQPTSSPRRSARAASMCLTASPIRCSPAILRQRTQRQRC